MAKFKSQTAVCARCNRMFTYMGYGFRYCERCRKVDEEEFDKVRTYIYDHGNATAVEIEKQTGVSNRRITQYLREGRLEIPENSPIYIKCEGCHKDIRSGRYCKTCAAKLSKELSGALLHELEVGEEPKATGKQRFKRS